MLRRAAALKEVDHPFYLGREMGDTVTEGIQQPGKGQTSDSETGVEKEMATGVVHSG